MKSGEKAGKQMTEPNNPNTPPGPGTPGTGGDATTVGNSAPYGNPAGQVPQYGAAPGSSPYGPPGYVAPAYGAPTPGAPDFGAANPYAPPAAGQYGQQPQAPVGGPGYADPGQYGQTAFSQPGHQYPAAGQPHNAQSAPAYGQYGQQAPQYGQQPGPAGPQYGADPFGGPQHAGSPSKLPKVLGAVGGVILAIAAIVLVTGFWLPGWFPKTLSQSAVEDGVKKVLSSDYSITNVDKVSCPSGESVSKGKTFTCDLSVGGQAQKVTITIIDDDGKYEVSRPS